MRLRRVRWATITAAYLNLALWAVPASARDKADVITLQNGDRITGTVKKLENAVLRVDLDYVDGTISIDWMKVANLESKNLFLVQLQDGATYSAKVATRSSEVATPDAHLQLEIAPEGLHPFVVNSSKIVRITQTSESVLERFSGEISLGATHSKGNNATQYNIGSGLDYTATDWGGTANYSSNLSSNTGAPTSTRNQLDFYTYRLLRRRDYFYAGSVGYLQSTVQSIQRQTSLGMSFGHYFKNTNSVRFSVLAGAGWQRTNYAPTDQPNLLQDVGVALISSNLQIFTFKKTRLNVTGTLAPALTQPGRLFAKANASYYLKVLGKFDWNFTFYGNWDTEPPQHLPSSDYGTTTGLSYTFGNK